MSRRSIIIPLLILTAAAVLLVVVRADWTSWTEHGKVRVTDDATVRADQIPLSTRISGTVHHVYVGDYERVTKGQLLIDLDDTDYQAALSQAKAALEEADAEYAANQDAKRAADATVAAARQAISGAEAGSAAAQAMIHGTQAELTHAQSEFRRQEILLAGKASTQQQFEETQAVRDRVTAQMQAHQAEFARSNTVVASARSALAAAEQQRAALNAKDQLLHAQIEARKAAITIAEVNLGYTRIYSPSAGSVGEFRVHPGQLLGPGIPIVDLIQSEIWVQANYRETQLAGVQPGDAAEITVDAVPGHTYFGRVAQISPASGSQFALLPPDNATGNFTKIVQRVPVRIELNDVDGIRGLRPGFSVSARIHVSSGDAHSGAETR